MASTSPEPGFRDPTHGRQTAEAAAPATVAAAMTEALDDTADAIERALCFPEGRSSRWRRSGLSRRGERIFNLAATLVLAVFVAGWTWVLDDVGGGSSAGAADGPTGAPGGVTVATARITAALTDADAPSVAYLTDAAIRAVVPLRGESGKLRALILDPGDTLPVGHLPAQAGLAFVERGPGSAAAAAASTTGAPADSLRAPGRTGVWRMVLAAGQAIAPVGDFTVITRRPLSARRNGSVGLYYIGSWPTERSPRSGYRTPTGFIEVTPENQDTYVSRHFRLRDFLTHGQDAVWPKYLVLDMRLVDKLELVLDELAEQGIRTDGIRVMSGFRTPNYNANEGNTAGRASLSRHMYGDASDVFIDNDGDGMMDDLNGDGRVDMDDARVIAAAAERVEREHPSLVGGVGLYSSGPGHGPFVHIDTRGYRARW